MEVERIKSELRCKLQASKLVNQFESSLDPNGFISGLSMSDRESLEAEILERNCSLEKESRRLALEVVPARNVSKNVKFKVCDYPPVSQALDAKGCKGNLCMWNFTPDVFSMLKEGCRFKVFLFLMLPFRYMESMFLYRKGRAFPMKIIARQTCKFTEAVRDLNLSR